MSGRTHSSTHSKRFRIRRSSVGEARRHVETVLTGWRLGPVVEVASLVASELATNVVNHAKGTGEFFDLSLRREPAVLVLEVADSYRWKMPELRKPEADDTSGRGLLIVDALAEAWGVRPRDAGKIVWVRLALREATHGKATHRGAGEREPAWRPGEGPA
ncbi:ATP-binding protein [Streptomyces zingiberis]|uniref:ATP-binding protein n=1 Tax=Streptomyces zingiberis TaxID=2053010 RepID=A0ABX1BSJ5_9ACTN|nr:ATP-binding protein [Streptomyces zingiberis]NJQ00704.1 ATP-binding protein [Streptomyces zingiberis]